MSPRSPAAAVTADRDTTTTAVARLADPAAEAAIGAACRTLHLPTVRAEAGRIAEAAARERLSHRTFLAEVLTAECDDREARRRVRRIHEARFPRLKRLVDFDLAALPSLPPATLAMLAAGGWIDAGEPVVLLGDSGTGKTHLLIGLGVAAADSMILKFARQHSLVLVSEDTDFGELLARQHTLAPSFVLLRTYEPMTPDEQAAVLLANLPRLRDELDRGAIVVIERSRLRVRRLPVLPPIPEQRDQ